ncbi:MAG: response regulator [Armatimonadota bacterium]|nr:response regulator [bacterium]
MGYRVLVVEDDPVVAVGIVSILQEAGHEVTGVARSGEEALEISASNSPEIALVDVKLPGMDGIKTTRKLVEQGSPAVIMLTAYADKNLVEGAAQAGAFTYLLKPADKETLLANLEIATARWSEFAELRKEAEDTRTALETRKLSERAKHVMMERLSWSEETAFAHMRHKCRNQNKTMHQVAEEIIAADEAFMGVIDKDPPKKDK